MKKSIKYVFIIGFLILVIAGCVISFTCFKSADVVAVYTRNNLSWDNAEFFEDGSLKLDLTDGKMTVMLKNDVAGKIGYNIYLYSKTKSSDAVRLSVKDMTEIDKAEYPYSLKDCDVKYAYRGYLGGDSEKKFTIESDSKDLRLSIIIEDNNAYPKNQKELPTIANVKFNAEVLLDGQYPRGSDYSFSLKDESGEVIETVHNDDGYISFSNIALNELGAHVYYLSQNEGNDKATSYDDSVYKINVVAEEKNIARVFYEKDGVETHTLPRFSNHKEAKGITDTKEYPTNDKKSNEPPNYLLIATVVIACLLVLMYVISSRKKG